MAGFCVNCGTPLVGAFCNKCGAKAISPSAPVQAPAPQVAAPVPPPPVVQPAPIAPQSSGMGKILLWVGGILLVLFLAGVGATVYGYYWAKHKVTNYVSAVTGGSSGPTKVVQSGDSCRLLSTADLQRVLGVTIEKSAESCKVLIPDARITPIPPESLSCSTSRSNMRASNRRKPRRGRLLKATTP